MQVAIVMNLKLLIFPFFFLFVAIANHSEANLIQMYQSTYIRFYICIFHRLPQSILGAKTAKTVMALRLHTPNTGKRRSISQNGFFPWNPFSQAVYFSLSYTINWSGALYYAIVDAIRFFS